jgi:hypothetical protein
MRGWRPGEKVDLLHDTGLLVVSLLDQKAVVLDPDGLLGDT